MRLLEQFRQICASVLHDDNEFAFSFEALLEHDDVFVFDFHEKIGFAFEIADLLIRACLFGDAFQRVVLVSTGS